LNRFEPMPVLVRLIAIEQKLDAVPGHLAK
jgi:hypothetical protein